MIERVVLQRRESHDGAIPQVGRKLFLVEASGLQNRRDAVFKWSPDIRACGVWSVVPGTGSKYRIVIGVGLRHRILRACVERLRGDRRSQLIRKTDAAIMRVPGSALVAASTDERADKVAKTAVRRLKAD